MSAVKELLESASGNQMYLLMNKDRPIYKFRFIDDNSIQILDIYEKPPFWIKDLEDWIRNRSAAKHREDIKRILENNNAMTLRGFVIFTRCLSLSDTLWVKKELDKIEWKSVSLYSNRFRESLGVVVTENDFGDTSNPTFSTDGSFPKCWVRRNNVPVLVKGANTGYEPFAEVFASRLRLANASVVKYDLEYSEQLHVDASLCETFTTESVILLPYSIVTNKLYLDEVRDFYDKIGCKSMFDDMLLLDAVSMNVDRHYRNFGVLLDSDTYDILTMAPIFDMNYCYGSASLSKVNTPLDEYMEWQRSRMFGDFIEAIHNNICRDSVDLIIESLRELKTTGINRCRPEFFERMVKISEIQIEKIKKIL